MLATKKKGLITSRPGGQVGGHDDDGVLKLSVHFGGQLRVDELLLVDDGAATKTMKTCNLRFNHFQPHSVKKSSHLQVV